MRNELSILVLIHADVETTDGLTNSSGLQGDSDVAPETLEHRIWIEVSLSKSMSAPDKAYDVPMIFRETAELAALTNQRWNARAQTGQAALRHRRFLEQASRISAKRNAELLSLPRRRTLTSWRRSFLACLEVFAGFPCLPCFQLGSPSAYHRRPVGPFKIRWTGSNALRSSMVVAPVACRGALAAFEPSFEVA